MAAAGKILPRLFRGIGTSAINANTTAAKEKPCALRTDVDDKPWCVHSAVGNAMRRRMAPKTTPPWTFAGESPFASLLTTMSNINANATA